MLAFAIRVNSCTLSCNKGLGVQHASHMGIAFCRVLLWAGLRPPKRLRKRWRRPTHRQHDRHIFLTGSAGHFSPRTSILWAVHQGCGHQLTSSWGSQRGWTGWLGGLIGWLLL
jgi:hypothetical protein